MKKLLSFLCIMVLCSSVMILSGCSRERISENADVSKEGTSSEVVEEDVDLNDKSLSSKYIENGQIVFDGISFNSCEYEFDEEASTNSENVINFRHINDKNNKYEVGDRLMIYKGENSLTSDDIDFIKSMAENDSYKEISYGGIDGYQFYAVGVYSFAFNYNDIYYEISCANEDDFNKMMQSLQFK